MKYDSIPVQVEARQYLPGKVVPGVFKEVGGSDNYYVVNQQGEKVIVNFGQWVVTEPDGIHHTALDDSVFNKKYKVVAGQSEKEEKDIATTSELKTIHTGKVSAATANTIRFDSEASSDSEAYKNCIVSVNAGGQTQGRNITSYNGAIRTATVDKDFDIIPNTESVFKIEKMEEVLIKEESKVESKKKEEVKK